MDKRIRPARTSIKGPIRASATNAIATSIARFAEPPMGYLRLARVASWSVCNTGRKATEECCSADVSGWNRVLKYIFVGRTDHGQNLIHQARCNSWAAENWPTKLDRRTNRGCARAAQKTKPQPKTASARAPPHTDARSNANLSRLGRTRRSKDVGLQSDPINLLVLSCYSQVFENAHRFAKIIVADAPAGTDCVNQASEQSPGSEANVMNQQTRNPNGTCN